MQIVNLILGWVRLLGPTRWGRVIIFFILLKITQIPGRNLSHFNSIFSIQSLLVFSGWRLEIFQTWLFPALRFWSDLDLLLLGKRVFERWFGFDLGFNLSILLVRQGVQRLPTFRAGFFRTLTFIKFRRKPFQILHFTFFQLGDIIYYGWRCF